MSKTSMALLLAPALLAVAGFAAVADRAAPTSACEIRAIRTPAGLEIDGVVHGRPGRSGRYELELRKSGPSANSDVSQGGDFTIPATGTAVVSASALSVSRGDVYRAAMTLSTGARCDLHLPAG